MGQPDGVSIGLLGGGFPDVRGALPEATLVEFADGLQEVDVVVPLGGTVDGELMDRTRPRLIQQFGVGLQGVDVAAARERRIAVAHVPAATTGNAAAVAEVAVLHLLALLRRWHEAQESVAMGRVGQPSGRTLAGKTVTVLGVGAIGTEIVTRLTAFGAVVLGVGRRAYQEQPGLHAVLAEDRYQRVGDMAGALARSQALVVCCPLTDETRGLVDGAALATMPPGGYVVNVARGPVIDRDALLAALRSGHLSGAGLDVAWREPIDPDDELLRENVTLTPHIGGVTEESYSAMAQAFAANVRRLQAGEPLAGRASP